ncbi:hypothetical protein [Ferruginibacter profundus]
MQTTDGNGNITKRPAAQDIKPKAFQFPATHMILFVEPTDRYILWIISHYPYFFNVFFTDDLRQSSPNAFNKGAIAEKYTLWIKSLRDRGMIKYGDEKPPITYRLTLKGKLFRLTTHPQWILIQVSAPIIVAITLWWLTNHKPTVAPETPTKEKQETIPNADSGLKHSAQTVPLKVKDSSLVDSGKTKTFKANH